MSQPCSLVVVAMGRKPGPGLEVDEVIAWVRTRGVATEAEVAAAFGVHTITARFKLEGGIARGELMCDEYSPDGDRLSRPNWRYADARD